MLDFARWFLDMAKRARVQDILIEPLRDQELWMLDLRRITK